MKYFKYKKNDFFNDKDKYLFEDYDDRPNWVSKVEFYKGNWYTLRKPQIKCTSIKCKKL